MAGCSPDMSFPDNPVSPNGISQPFAVDFAPRALFGGASAVGTVTLSAPAPSGGLRVTLSSSDDNVGVPPTVIVPAGALATNFGVDTRRVPADLTASVEAAAGGESRAGSLPVWAELPEFFSWISEPGTFQGAGRMGRATGDNFQFIASCRISDVEVRARGGSLETNWQASFLAAPGQPLRTGTYEITPPASGTRTGAGLSVSIFGLSACVRPAGRFVVHEVDVRDDGTVGRFWATFEQQCSGIPVLIGAVRVTNPPTNRSPFDRAPCLR